MNAFSQIALITIGMIATTIGFMGAMLPGGEAYALVLSVGIIALLCGLCD